MSNRTKNIRLFFISKMIAIIILLFCGPSSQAQNDADSVTVVEQPPEEGIVEENDSDKGSANFLKNWENNDDSSLRQRHLSDSVIKKMREDKDFWYANAIFEKEKKKEAKTYDSDYIPLGQRTWFQTLIWLIIIGGFATFLMIYLSGSNVGLFRKRSKAIRSAEEQEEITEDIFAINYQKEIDKATAQGNYRLAIRLMYLRLLKNLSEKNIIQYKQDKTNLDYLMQLHQTKHYGNFFKVTRNYEYSWYGKFEVSEPAYKLIRSEFDQLDIEMR